MKTLRTMLSACVLSTVCVFGTGVAPVQAQPIDPNKYPTLSDKELGHVRRLVALSQQLPGDWSGMSSQFLVTERPLQFQIAFAGMSLAIVHHQLTPAYRELYQGAIQAYIEKLQHPDIWERWSISSRGGVVNGLMSDVGPGWMDPIIKDNIMLKAYLLQLGAAHDMLYGGNKYDQPGAFTFDYRGNGFGNGNITFKYSLSDIARNIHQEVIDSDYVGSACEPARIFWACNAPSSVGFIHFDHLHGTRYADILPKVKQAWVSKGLIDTKSYTYKAVVFTKWDDSSTIDHAAPLTPMTAGIGGWSGMFNHAWDGQFVEAAYYGVDNSSRNQMLNYFLSGDYAKSVPRLDHPGTAYYSVLWGFFLNYAAEVGDKEAVTKMLDYAERNYHPVWKEGQYFYPRSDDYSVDAQGNSHGVDSWTGNVFIPLARFNRGGGFSRLYNQPWGEEQYRQPFISDVDALTTGVSQAYFDPAKNALIVTITAGPVAAKQVSFTVRQLDPSKTYEVTENGKKLGRLDRNASRRNPSLVWQPDGSVVVSTQLDAARTFIFAAN